MSSVHPGLDADTALSYVGKTVLMELTWDGESFWQCAHIVGIVLPMAGVQDNAYFMAISVAAQYPFPDETFLADIRTIRVVRNRDRRNSGNGLGRLALPALSRSRAALPARRNGSTVPTNGSTGGAHP